MDDKENKKKALLIAIAVVIGVMVVGIMIGRYIIQS